MPYGTSGLLCGSSCHGNTLRKAEARHGGGSILTSILPSNEIQVTRGLELIMSKGHKKVGVLGFSFKAGTDDLRESPLIEVTERLLGKGYELRIYDRNVNLATLVGANREFILNRIPHISRLMVPDIGAVLDHSETIVIGNQDPEFNSVPERLRPDQVLVDFVRISPRGSKTSNYEGICW